jgi:hypothetical protein
MSRYTEPRTLLRWGKNDRLQILKMLAWVVYDREGIRSAGSLEARVDALCEPVVRIVLGEPLLTLERCSKQNNEQK